MHICCDLVDQIALMPGFIWAAGPWCKPPPCAKGGRMASGFEYLSPPGSRQNYRGKYQAGHSVFPASWSATLARSGQLHSHIGDAGINASTSKLRANAPAPWNSRSPVWEQYIPKWQPIRPQYRPVSVTSLPPRLAKQALANSLDRTLSTSPSDTIRPGNVATDWTLLLNANRIDHHIQRPWPEYQPESSAPVGRRWHSHNLGKLHEPAYRVEAFPTEGQLLGEELDGGLSAPPS